ncbi:helix-turn-helix transcriptional regulator [Gloeobacter morelensis]|uniref:WYL domain-containing transcriptional regulator n=1 Tax=Gloeobacter morelensis MG652769 TaxID=2781736 RepID=A0ABY3PJD6_9CYAN|nr:WYL domain-containing transcriptional regulator [Gloeobacter morelensis]UFP93782.1 WYL domain-containing transcriptional regulator [Gloeobacter morelensis MG652769]
MADVSLEQLDRLLKIDRLVRLGQARSTAQLARALGVSTGTVQRALLTLRDEYGAPLVVDRVRGYVYRETTWQLPPLPLTQGELFVLMAGNRLLAAAEGTLYEQQIQSAIAQLVHHLPKLAWVDLETVRDYLHTSAELPATFNDFEVWQQLGDAFESGLQTLIGYAAPGEVPITRQVNPYLLYVWRGYEPYLIGYDLGTKQFEAFRVDRIQVVQTLGDKFTRDPAFDPRPIIDKINQLQLGTAVTRVSVRLTPRAARALRGRLLHPTQVSTTLADGSLRLQMHVSELEALKRWVLGFGAEAVVEEPRALVEQIRAELGKLAALYGTPVAR